MARAGTIKVQLQGLQQLINHLNTLKRALRSKILRKAVGKAVQPIMKDAKARVPVRHGLLKKAMGFRVRTLRKNGVVVGIVGPRTGFRTQVGVDRNGKPIYGNPTRYAHLVEYGTVRAAAKPFLRPAWSAGRNQAAVTLARVAAEELEKEAAKLGGRK